MGKFRFPVSYVSDVNANFIRFNGLGEPTRAKAITIMQHHVARCPNPTSGARWATTTESTTVITGPTCLSGYHQPHWRDTADANRIDDLLAFARVDLVPDKATPPRRVNRPAV